MRRLRVAPRSFNERQASLRRAGRPAQASAWLVGRGGAAPGVSQPKTRLRLGYAGRCRTASPSQYTRHFAGPSNVARVNARPSEAVGVDEYERGRWVLPAELRQAALDRERLLQQLLVFVVRLSLAIGVRGSQPEAGERRCNRLGLAKRPA